MSSFEENNQGLELSEDEQLLNEDPIPELTLLPTLQNCEGNLVQDI